MTLVNNNTGVAPAYPTSAALPQMLPTTQQQWQDFLNALQSKFPQLPLIPLIDSSSTVNVVTLTTSSVLNSSYTVGMNVLFQPANTNTSVVNINVNGLGNKNLVISGGGFPAVGTIVAGYVYSATYDGTHFVLQTNLGDGSSGGGGGVTSITGTPNQVVADVSTGAVTLSLDSVNGVVIDVGAGNFNSPIQLINETNDPTVIATNILTYPTVNPTGQFFAQLQYDAPHANGVSGVLGAGAAVALETGLSHTCIQAADGHTEIYQQDLVGIINRVSNWDKNRLFHVVAGTALGELIASDTALADGAGSSTGTLTTAPSSGNPTKWIKINDNGTIRSIPAW